MWRKKEHTFVNIKAIINKHIMTLKWPNTLTECIRSKTANLFLATQTAVKPEDLFPSGAEIKKIKNTVHAVNAHR